MQEFSFEFKRFDPPKDFKLTKHKGFRLMCSVKSQNKMYGDYVKQRRSPKDKTFELYLKYLLFWNENRWIKKYAK